MAHVMHNMDEVWVFLKNLILEHGKHEEVYFYGFQLHIYLKIYNIEMKKYIDLLFEYYCCCSRWLGMQKA